MKDGKEETVEQFIERTGCFPVKDGSKIKTGDNLNFYLTDDKITLEAIANKYEIPLKELRELAFKEEWSKNRENLFRRTRNQVQKVMTEQLKDLLEVNLKIQQLKTIQLMQTVDYIQNHLSVYGDLWLRDPDDPGQILKDSNGLPRKIPIPKEVQDAQALVQLTQGLNSLIGERDEGNETPLLNAKGDSVEPDFQDVFGSNKESK